MEHDRTERILRCYYNCVVNTLGGILSLSLFGAGLVVAHEVMLPSGKVMPWGMGEVIEKHTVAPYVLGGR